MDNFKFRIKDIEKYIDAFFDGRNIEFKLARRLVNKEYAIKGGFLLIFLVTLLLNLFFESMRASFGFMFGKSFNIINVFFSFNIIKYFPIYTIAYILASVIYIKFISSARASFKEIDEGQKGTSRFATREEIDKQYKAVPMRRDEYSGKGGVPIAWGKKLYIENGREVYKEVIYIDDSPVNNLLIGTTRSGKGETFVVPTIDIYSRAGVKPSFVVNDPKGELIAMCKDTLIKRGYDILLLNLVDPLNSISYNPLELIKQAYKRGDFDDAQLLCRTFTTALYETSSKDNEFFIISARALVNALILAICDECISKGEEDKITLYTVSKMLTELGGNDYKEKESGIMKNALDEYFKALPVTSVARSQYASSSFASDRSRGNIFATADTKLNSYTMDKIAKLTSKNSVDLKGIGFDEYFEKTIKVTVTRELEYLSIGTKTISNRCSLLYDDLSSIEANLNNEIKNEFVGVKDISIAINSTKNQLKEQLLKDIKAYNMIGHDVTERIVLEISKVNLSKEGVYEVTYRAPKTKPKAVFMVTPDYDKSNHFLTSIFVNQLYTVLAKEASISDTGKCDKEVIFLLDEAGNMPAIEGLANIITVCLGRGIRFNLVIQSYNQLKSLYGDDDATIIGNCGNQIYILSNEGETSDKFSNLLGEQTIISNSRSGEVFGINKTQTETLDARKLLMGSELKLQEGETVVIRVIKRRDNEGNKITPHPIYNKGEYALKYRYEYLSKEFDNLNVFKDVEVESLHRNVELEKLLIDFDRKKEEKEQEEIKQEQEKIEILSNKCTISDEDKILETKVSVELYLEVMTFLKKVEFEHDYAPIKQAKTLKDIVIYLEGVKREDCINHIENLAKKYNI